jgi:hypothetical protein
MEMENTTEQKSETIREALIRLATTNTSNETDNKIMTIILRRLGYNNVVIVTGIVYLTGFGHPQSINSIAKTIYETLKSKGEI